jgi:hypothetical protein
LTDPEAAATSGVEYGTELLAFADAMVGEDDEALTHVRHAVIEVLSPPLWWMPQGWHPITRKGNTRKDNTRNGNTRQDNIRKGNIRKVMAHQDPCLARALRRLRRLHQPRVAVGRPDSMPSICSNGG